MEDFIAQYWGILLAALIIVLAAIWLLRGRNGTAVEPHDDELTGINIHDEEGRSNPPPAPPLAPEPVRIVPKENAADSIIEEARTDEATVETEAALEHAGQVATSKAAEAFEAAKENAPEIAPPVGEADNLQLMKGVGPKLVQRLADLGITRFDQIAAWTPQDIAEVDSRLGNFKGRIARDNWVDQAAYLARGDRAGFEAKYGALGA